MKTEEGNVWHPWWRPLCSWMA